MKKIVLLIALLLAAGFTLSAQLDPFMPLNPITLGQGGSYTANGEGYNAFFYNPAGFARRSEFTLASVNIYGLLDRNMLDFAFQTALQQINGGAPAANVASRIDLPADISGIDTSAFEGLIEGVGDYLTDVNTQDPDAIENAIVNILTDTTSEYYDDIQAIALEIDSDGDLSNGVTLDPDVTQEELISTILESDVDLADLVDDVIAEIETESGIDAATYGVEDLGTQVTDLLNEAFPSGNLMAGVSAGIGYVGNGLGLGLFANAEANLVTPDGSSMLEATGSVLASVSLVGGMAFELFEGFDLGFSVRPTILGYTSIDPRLILSQLMSASGGSADILNTILANSIYKGLYLGLDVGVLWDIGPLTLGATLKDINPFPVQYSVIDPSSYATLEEALLDLIRVDSGTPAAEGDPVYNVPPFKLNLGVQFHPDLGVVSQVFDPRIGLDLMDVFGFLRSVDDVALLAQSYNFLDHVNLGAEVQLLGIIDIRAGFYKAAFTAGLGFELPVLHLNAAVALDDLNWEEMAAGADPVFQQVGFSIEVAFRFPEAKAAPKDEKKAEE